MNLPEKGLIIKKEWLDKIFNVSEKHNCTKSWEVRGTNSLIRGRIGLIESGTKTVVGECIIEDSFQLSEKLFEENIDKHQIECHYSDIPYSHPYAWKLVDVVCYAEPIPYNHKQGSQVWVNL